MRTKSIKTAKKPNFINNLTTDCELMDNLSSDSKKLLQTLVNEIWYSLKNYTYGNLKFNDQNSGDYDDNTFTIELHPGAPAWGQLDTDYQVFIKYDDDECYTVAFDFNGGVISYDTPNDNQIIRFNGDTTPLRLNNIQVITFDDYIKDKKLEDICPIINRVNTAAALANSFFDALKTRLKLHSHLLSMIAE